MIASRFKAPSQAIVASLPVVSPATCTADSVLLEDGRRRVRGDATDGALRRGLRSNGRRGGPRDQLLVLAMGGGVREPPPRSRRRRPLGVLHRPRQSRRMIRPDHRARLRVLLAPLRSPPREPPPPPRRWTLARVPLPALDGTWPTTTRAPHPPPTSPSPPPRSRAPCPTPPDCISVRTTTWTASLEATPPRGRGVPAAQPWSFRRGCPTGDA